MCREAWQRPAPLPFSCLSSQPFCGEPGRGPGCEHGQFLSLLDSKVIWKRNRLLYHRATWSLVQQLTTPFLLQNHKRAAGSESLRSLGRRQTQILEADTAIIHLQREGANLQTSYRVVPFPFISTPFCTQTNIVVSERLGDGLTGMMCKHEGLGFESPHKRNQV